MLIIGKSTSWAVMNWLSGLFIHIFIRQMPVYNHNGWTYETNNQNWYCAALCAALSEDSHHRMQCDFVYLIHIFTVSHIFPFIYRCQALFRSNTSLWLDVSFNDFLQKHGFDHFDLILFKRLCCEISFSDFVYLLLDHITNKEYCSKYTLTYLKWKLSDEFLSLKFSFFLMSWYIWISWTMIWESYTVVHWHAKL